MRVAKVGTPVATTNWHNGQLRDDDGSTDGSSDFLGGLDAETDVALAVTDNDDGLEAGTLTGTGLLLDRLDLYINSHQHTILHPISCMYILVLTFITSSLSLGKKKSTIWYSLMGRECR